MKTLVSFCSLFVLSICAPLIAGAQVNSIAKNPATATISRYIASTKDEMVLFCGKEEVAYAVTVVDSASLINSASRYYTIRDYKNNDDRPYKGASDSPIRQQVHPYLVTHEYQPANLSYNHTWYEGIGMHYDLLLDQLVVQTQKRAFNIVLEKEKVQEAHLFGERIIPYTPEEWRNMPGGNYLILLHEGAYPLVKKYAATKKTTVTDGFPLVSYQTNRKFFLRKDGVCQPVSNKNSVLKLFPQHKQALNTFAKAHDLDFGEQQREKSLLALIEYLETLH